MTEKRRVVVTGLGMVTPLGCEVETVFARLLVNVSAVSELLEKYRESLVQSAIRKEGKLCGSSIRVSSPAQSLRRAATASLVAGPPHSADPLLNRACAQVPPAASSQAARDDAPQTPARF